MTRLAVGLLSLALLAAPLAAESLDAFRKGLRERGYVESQTIVIEPRFASERLERYQDLVAELAHLKVDIIVVASTQMALADSIPICASSIDRSDIRRCRSMPSHDEFSDR